MEKKIVSKKRFIFSIIISLLIWDLIVSLLGQLIISLVSKFTDNNILTSFVSYIVWIFKSILIISLCYLNNKKKRVAKYELEKTKINILIIFYILLIGLSITDITEGIILNPIIWIPLVIIHMLLIAIVNDIMFRRCISNEER